MTTDRTPRRFHRRLAALVAAILGVTTVSALSLVSPAPAGAAPGSGTGPNGQTITVSDVDDLDPNGETVTVTGEGFDAAAGFNVSTMGLYLSVCVDNGPSQAPSPCLGGVDQSGETVTTRWITNNPIGDSEVVPISADGKFTTTLRVSSWDDHTDCLALPEGRSCKIVTRVDHRGGGNRTQDVKVPIDFADGPRLRLSPSGGFDPTGDDIEVHGSGYPTDPPGIYVVYGPEPQNSSDSSPYLVANFIPSAAMPGGTFTTTLEGVKAVYTGGDEVDYDFRTGGGFVSTFRAHGVPDPSGDWAASVPVAFERRTTEQSFVTAALTDFLGVEPSESQVATGVTQLRQRGKPNYLRTLSTSDAWLASVIDKLYIDTLGRPSDPVGKDFWIGQLRGGRTVASVAAQFYASNEYYAGIGGGTPGSWVDDLYLKLLLRASDATGRAYWIDQISATSRASVAFRFYQSGESARTRVRGLYQALLGRATDQVGLEYWAGRVVTQGDLTLAVFLADSDEYQRRAVSRFP